MLEHFSHQVSPGVWRSQIETTHLSLMFNSNSGPGGFNLFLSGLRGIYKSNYIASQIVLESEAAAMHQHKGEKLFYVLCKKYRSK